LGLRTFEAIIFAGHAVLASIAFQIFEPSCIHCADIGLTEVAFLVWLSCQTVILTG
jgi:hypothetical protein